MKQKLLFIIASIFIFNLLYAQKIIPLTPAQKQQFLAAHNAYRKAVGAPPLQWSDQLANYAKHWAMVLASTESTKNSPNNKYGENVYTTSLDVNPQAAVDHWASEKKYYNGQPITLDNYWIFGHYTQIIWSTTKQVGCAIAQDKDGTYYVVCEYSPAGNVIGKKPVPNYPHHPVQ